MPSEGAFPGSDVAVTLRKPKKYAVMLPQIVEMAEAGSGVDFISRALSIGAEVVRDALHLHRTGKQPPSRVDGRRRKPRQPGKPFVPKYQQVVPEVDRRRKAGAGFDRLIREMKVSPWHSRQGLRHRQPRRGRRRSRGPEAFAAAL